MENRRSIDVEHPAIHPARGLVIFATGNPNPYLYDGSTRLGANAYTDFYRCHSTSTPASSPWWDEHVPGTTSGTMMRWHRLCFLMVKNDQGQERPVVAEAGKRGRASLVNRAERAAHQKSEPFVAQSATMWTAPPQDGYVNIYPGAQGGNEW